MIRTFLSSFWHTESSFVKRYGCLPVHQDKGVTYQFTESRSPRRRGSRLWHFMPLLAVIRQASSMVWARLRHGKSSKMHLTSWNTMEKKAKSVLTFLPKLKPLYANSTIREHKRWEINKERAAAFCKSKKDLDALLPTQDALILHTKRANYQTMVWNKALEPCPSLPKPEDSGWYYE